MGNVSSGMKAIVIKDIASHFWTESPHGWAIPTAESSSSGMALPGIGSAVVQQKVAELGFKLLSLPGYSPDLNLIEGLWKWLRGEVTQQHCYKTMREFFLACKSLIERINLEPEAIIQRLRSKFELDPDFLYVPIRFLNSVSQAGEFQQMCKSYDLNHGHTCY